LLLTLAERHKLAIVEDCAHAHGARWRGRPVGAIGDCGTFSFQESKTMTAGEGGMVTTNSAEVAESCVQYRSCGRHEGESWYIHHVLPVNYRMAELLAAVLLPQLERLPQHLAIKQKAARFLNVRLSQIPGITTVPPTADCDVHGYYLFQLRYDSSRFDGVPRNTFVQALEAEGVPCHIGYPWPLSNNPVFHNDPSIRGLKFPVTERLCAETVVIPHQVLLSAEEDLEDVARAVVKIHENRAELAARSAAAC
jgi:dTDP-4-amino-4,6-dideoxygalactose transaminase